MKIKYIFSIALATLPYFLFAERKQTSKEVLINSPRLEVKNINIWIKGGYDDMDSMKIVFWDKVFSHYKPLQIGNIRELTSKSLSKDYHFQINDQISPGYLQLTIAKAYSSDLKYLVEPGDSINASLMFDYITFTGKGAEKYNCINRINQIYHEANNRWNELHFNVQPYKANIEASLKKFDYIYEKQLIVLNEYKTRISPLGFQIISMNLIGMKRKLQSDLVERMYGFADSIQRIDLKNVYKKLCLSYKKDTFSNSIVLLTDEFINSIIGNLRNDRRLIDNSGEFVYIKTNFSGEYRDRLMVSLFTDYFEVLPNADSLLSDAISNAENSYCKGLLDAMAQNLLKGAKAYDFSLEDINGKSIRLSDFLGKVVFVDFWFNGCSGCSRYYLNELSKAEEKFENNSNVIFITISIDEKKDVWLDGVRSGKYTSATAVNLYTQGKGAEHPVISTFKVQSYPRPILIDKKGRIITVSRKDLSTSRSIIDQINDALLNNK